MQKGTGFEPAALPSGLPETDCDGPHREWQARSTLELVGERFPGEGQAGRDPASGREKESLLSQRNCMHMQVDKKKHASAVPERTKDGCLSPMDSYILAYKNACCQV